GGARLFTNGGAAAGLAGADENIVGKPASSETDIAVAVSAGKADAGLAIEAVARQQGLNFLPLQWERFDLVVRRIEYFNKPLQQLFSFARTHAFAGRPGWLGGYRIGSSGRVGFNGRR